MLRFLNAWLQDATVPLMLRLAGVLTMALPLAYLAGSAAGDIGAILIALLFLAESGRARRWDWLREPWVRVAFALWLYLVIRSVLAAQPLDAIDRALPWIRFPLFAAALAYGALRYEPVRRGTLYSLGAAVIFLLGDGLLQYLTGSDAFGRAVRFTDEGAIRLSGPFSAPVLGIVLVWTAFPFLAWALGRQSRRTKAEGLLLALLFLVTVFLSGERMAFLLALFGFALLFVLQPATRRHLLVFGVIATLTLSVLVYINPSLLTRQVESTVTTAETYETSNYGVIWKSALTVFRDHPVFGVGLKNYRSACADPAYGPTDAPSLVLRCNLHPHHLYLEWLAEGGIVGLGLFLAMLALLLKPVALHFKRLRDDALFLGLLIAVAIKLWPLSTAISFFVPWSVIPFWLYCGWLAAYTATPDHPQPPRSHSRTPR